MVDEDWQVHRRYFPGGELMTEWAERNGQLHGWRRHWFAGGRLFSETEYFDGLPHGVIREWTEDGQLTLLATFYLLVWPPSLFICMKYLKT